MTPSKSILVADIGGTNVRFAVAEARDGATKAHLSAFAAYPVARYPEVADALDAYRTDQSPPAFEAVCLAVAGPVKDGRAALTNAAWRFDEHALSARLGCPVRLVNDFEALAWAAPLLDTEDTAQIKAGTAVPGAPIAVVGPGTGFGTALWIPHSGGGLVVPAEAGHCAFPAIAAEERKVADYIQNTEGYVSVEAVLSGPGLARIDAALRAQTAAPRSSAQILADAATDPQARAAIDLFLESFGCVAGNIALSCGARGGVLLAGGMSQALADHYAASAFNARFNQRGPMTAYMEAIPVALITTPHAALLGAAAKIFGKKS